MNHIAVDGIKAAEQVKKAGSALAAAKNELRDAKDQLDRGEMTKEAYNDYKTNLAAATVNFANAQIALGSTLATATNTSIAGGFTAGLKGEHSKTVSTDTQKTGTWQGTELNAANTTFMGDDFTVIGGKGNLGNLNVDNLTRLTLKAGSNTTSSSSQSKTNAQTASINTAGNVSLGASTQKSSAQSSSTTHSNTTFNVDSLNGYADTTTLNGGRIIAGGGDYTTDKLTIETVQDNQSSSNRSSGANIGINLSGGTPSGGSLGANKTKGNEDNITAAKQSGIVYTNDDHTLTAVDTVNKGGIIAHIQTDSEGNQVEYNVNFTTNTLVNEDLVNTKVKDQRNLGGSMGVGTGKDGESINNVGIQAGHTGQDFESITQGTIGEGAVVTSDAHTGQDSLSGVNRDAFNTELVIKDQQTAGLNVDANIDARVFTEAGRTEIIDEQKELVENSRQLGNNIEGSVVLGYDTSNNILMYAEETV